NHTPELTGHNVNIPWFVSRGYLIFEPDFYYKPGKTYQSIVDAVNGAAKKLEEIPYVDTKRMGAQGQSFGGYATNVIATGTTVFKAACEMAGPTDIISEYGSIRFGGSSNQMSADIGQRNLRVFPWEHPEVFIENSPVFHVGRMKTPLLICHNQNDGGILYPQAIELFMAMRRAGKPGWLLEYDKEDHALYEERNQIDFTLRVEQFFGHYLKGAPAPVWMTKGIAVKDKTTVSGFSLDAAGVCSPSCEVCRQLSATGRK
ncbi:MAG: prolyl oligopeptidase family serine peptidase, partial [Chitinophagaceae bacterium]|nr:prolyl oligopeptidase family serine peptidase [Chitinophagaceae bacterium]